MSRSIGIIIDILYGIYGLKSFSNLNSSKKLPSFDNANPVELDVQNIPGRRQEAVIKISKQITSAMVMKYYSQVII